MTFGEAIDNLKIQEDGNHLNEVTRESWLNQRRYITFKKGYFDFAKAAEEAGDMGTFLQIDERPKLSSIFSIDVNLFYDSAYSKTVMPRIIHNLENRNVTSEYAPTHEDILAEDWYILPR